MYFCICLVYHLINRFIRQLETNVWNSGKIMYLVTISRYEIECYKYGLLSHRKTRDFRAESIRRKEHRL